MLDAWINEPPARLSAAESSSARCRTPRHDAIGSRAERTVGGLTLREAVDLTEERSENPAFGDVMYEVNPGAHRSDEYVRNGKVDDEVVGGRVHPLVASYDHYDGDVADQRQENYQAVHCHLSKTRTMTTLCERESLCGESSREWYYKFDYLFFGYHCWYLTFRVMFSKIVRNTANRSVWGGKNFLNKTLLYLRTSMNQ